MRFTENEIIRLVDRIVLVTLFPQGQTQQMIKGRVVACDGVTLTLKGDADVENTLEAPDDLAPQPSGRTLRRLKQGEQVDLSLKDLADMAWRGPI